MPARQHGQRPSGYAARSHGQRPSGNNNDHPLMQTAELSFVVILAVMAAFYFIFIRPARKEQTRLEETIRDLHVGDEVITTAGFFARITEIRTPEQGDVELILDFGGGIEIRALTTSILRRIDSDEATAERAKEKVRGP